LALAVAPRQIVRGDDHVACAGRARLSLLLGCCHAVTVSAVTGDEETNDDECIGDDQGDAVAAARSSACDRLAGEYDGAAHRRELLPAEAERQRVCEEK